MTIPEPSGSQQAEGRRRESCRPIKEQIATRADADVQAWLKVGGDGYQSRMNAILRQAMLRAAERMNPWTSDHSSVGMAGTGRSPRRSASQRCKTQHGQLPCIWQHTLNAAIGGAGVPLGRS
ncbi:MAG: BrnA antitoxin family protein [Boseongicola sp.]|nr:BrnA antitoxin family protein [Boseongicola sp.]